MAAVPPWTPWLRVTVVAAVLLSLGLIAWLDRHLDFGERIRARLLLGVPWGTLVAALGVLGVYLFVQGGMTNWRRPMVVPFRSWSYFYPLGMAVAPFAHGGVGHLAGNLSGTLVLGTLAEYAWGHFPDERGATAFSSLWTNPYARAFLLFPLGIAVVGLLTSLFSWGPVVGFSGVVFAFAGFSLVRYPLGTVIALEAEDVLWFAYRAVQEPVFVSRAKPQFVTPWWAGIAVQGHLLGLFLGLVAGALVLRRREMRSFSRLWAGTLIVATSVSLWAIWWFRGNQQYVLYRGVGLLVVLALALLIGLGLRARRGEWRLFGVPSRQVAILGLLLPVLVVAFVAVPLNLSTVAHASAPGDGPAFQVRDYTVTYAENATNGMTSVVNVSALGETTAVRTSGVIVISERRHLWSNALSTSRLAFLGNASVRVGGLGWRRSIDVGRRGWVVGSNGTAYRVWMRPPGGEWRLAYTSEPVFVEPVLAGKRVGIDPDPESFRITVRRNGTNRTLARAPLPNRNASVTAAGIRFVRDNRSILATYNATRIRIAKRETYPGAS